MFLRKKINDIICRNRWLDRFGANCRLILFEYTRQTRLERQQIYLGKFIGRDLLYYQYLRPPRLPFGGGQHCLGNHCSCRHFQKEIKQKSHPKGGFLSTALYLFSMK